MKKERRYFLIDLSVISPELEDRSILKLSDEEFMTESEKQGLTYSEESFINCFNASEGMSINSFLRIINV
jgi:hypothetical protein